MSKTIDLEGILTPDALACKVSHTWNTWNMYRQNWVTEKEEVQRYVFATDTTKTSNASLPWSNRTTIPKLCQIRDNLFANYMATMFPKRKNVIWEAATKEDADELKSEAIESYMGWVIDQPQYYNEVAKLVLDYIDYGNCFAMPEWVDSRNRASGGDKDQYGFVGPRLRRICPLDIVFNPTAPSFAESPKVIRSIISLGEVKEVLEREAKTPEEQEDMKVLWDYMKNIRKAASAHHSDNTTTKNAIYQISGFDSFYHYLMDNQVEVLTFYGDMYNVDEDKFERNQIIKVVDRHKIISQRPNPSFFGSAPIYHVGWRIRPDNLWAMGPLDNLVGMQYRIDHLENMKADIWDLTRYPVFKRKGYVEDFDWAPGEHIFVGDDGDVELLAPDVNALQANTEISILEQKMEEMAGSPKEAMGFRTPGEKTKYEVQRLENAASRIFQNKISQFEMHGSECWLNSMLELSRRYMNSQVISIFDEEFKIQTFMTLTPQDITGMGRIRPMAARHFAEQAQMVQDLNNFLASPAGQDPTVKVHFSGVKLAKMWEELLDLEEYTVVQPFIGISEAAQAQQLQNVAQEQTMMATQTASGIGSDFDPEANQANQPPVGGPPQGGIGPGGPPPSGPGMVPNGGNQAPGRPPR